jgi:nucleotide-binding universal stress UspA family protein
VATVTVLLAYIRTLIVGSTSQRILLGVACPVLAVKAPH